ncbi:MAG: hypothetical protein AAFX94_01865 [Myxococcota bacterium]
MSISDVEKSAIPGVLNSDILGPDKPMSAKALREVSRTGNYLRDGPSMMLTTSWAPTPAGEGETLAPPDERTLFVWRVPSRDVHVRAEVRIRASIETGGAVDFIPRTDRTFTTITAAGTGNVESYTGVLDLVAAEYQTLRLNARARGGGATGAIGAPASWNGSTTSTIRFVDGVEVVSETWNDAELSTGRYFLNISQGGVSVASKRIRRVVANQIVLAELFTTAEFNVVGYTTNLDFEIASAVPSFRLVSLAVMGVP